jgi:hypothetical protein
MAGYEGQEGLIVGALLAHDGPGLSDEGPLEGELHVPLPDTPNLSVHKAFGEEVVLLAAEIEIGAEPLQQVVPVCLVIQPGRRMESHGDRQENLVVTPGQLAEVGLPDLPVQHPQLQHDADQQCG